MPLETQSELSAVGITYKNGERKNGNAAKWKTNGKKNENSVSVCERELAHEEHTPYNLTKWNEWNLVSDLCGYSRPSLLRCAYTFCCRGWFLFLPLSLNELLVLCFVLLSFFFYFIRNSGLCSMMILNILFSQNVYENHAPSINIQTKCFNIPQLKICNSTTIRSHILNGHLVYSHSVLLCVPFFCALRSVEYFSKYVWNAMDVKPWPAWLRGRNNDGFAYVIRNKWPRAQTTDSQKNGQQQ